MDSPVESYVLTERGKESGGKSGEIRCQFIILARKDEPTPDCLTEGWAAVGFVSPASFNRGL